MRSELGEMDKFQNGSTANDEGSNNLICVNPKNICLKKDEIFNLTATIYSENFDDKLIIWSTSNPDVATVINGEVTAKAIGKAYIYAEVLDGSGECDYCCVDVEEQKLNKKVGQFVFDCKIGKIFKKLFKR